MKRTLVKSAAMVAVGLLLAPLAGAASLGLVPAAQMAGPGDTVFVDLVIDGLGAGGPDSLGVFDIDVSFDAAALSLVDYTVTSLLGDPSLGEAIETSLGSLGGGLVNVGVLSLLEADGISCFFCIPPFLDDIQPASFSIATFEFMVDVLPPGSETAIAVDAVFALGDAFGDPLALTGLSGATISNPASTGPGPGPGIPEPATIVLLGLGLVAARLTSKNKTA